MKSKILILLLLTSRNIFSQDQQTIEYLDNKIADHFDNYTPELYRYGGLTFYGETATTFSSQQVDEELELFNLLKESPLLDAPSKRVFALSHNLLIHSPKQGRELLSLLNRPTENTEIISQLFLEALFAGPYGEEVALDNLESSNQSWSEYWAGYLNRNAIYDTSISRIMSAIQSSKNVEFQLNLLSSLMYIGSPQSVDFVKQIIDTTKNDLVQARVIFVYAELTGYQGIQVLEQVKTVGENSKSEKESSLKWLKEETNQENIFGTEVSNDSDFAMRFGDINSPSMMWLENNGFLKTKMLNNPKPLSKEEKNKILDLLIESKCFGLEAIKGALFLSIKQEDMDKLLELRRLNFYSPNGYTTGRAKTLGIFIRSLKKE
ncbi:MAG: hypothetical protein ABJF04_13300 [Reichenbachiella sp.]|uniref:hypothetical protein n=1 Tax=Reichenbachiella sp. TaxID=2184521 RepID=UPI0032633C23